MPRPTHSELPHARDEELAVQELADEVLVYDLKRHKAHCLNPAVARIWKRCDGKTTVAELARHLGEAEESAIAEEAVWVALEQLSKAHLLSILCLDRCGRSVLRTFVDSVLCLTRADWERRDA